jgi:alpha-glucosidase
LAARRGPRYRAWKLLLDFVPNHSSTSIAGRKPLIARDNLKRDWYIHAIRHPFCARPTTGPATLARVVGNGTRPGNITSTPWKEQPDLNWRNPDLMRDARTRCAWRPRSHVDGFRIDAVAHRVKADGPSRQSAQPRLWPALRDKVLQLHSTGQPEAYDVADFARWPIPMATAC